MRFILSEGPTTWRQWIGCVATIALTIVGAGLFLSIWIRGVEGVHTTSRGIDWFLYMPDVIDDAPTPCRTGEVSGYSRGRDGEAHPVNEMSFQTSCTPANVMREMAPFLTSRGYQETSIPYGSQLLRQMHADVVHSFARHEQGRDWTESVHVLFNRSDSGTVVTFSHLPGY